MKWEKNGRWYCVSDVVAEGKWEDVKRQGEITGPGKRIWLKQYDDFVRFEGKTYNNLWLDVIRERIGQENVKVDAWTSKDVSMILRYQDLGYVVMEFVGAESWVDVEEVVRVLI